MAAIDFVARARDLAHRADPLICPILVMLLIQDQALRHVPGRKYWA